MNASRSSFLTNTESHSERARERETTLERVGSPADRKQTPSDNCPDENHHSIKKKGFPELVRKREELAEKKRARDTKRVGRPIEQQQAAHKQSQNKNRRTARRIKHTQMEQTV